MKTTLVRFVTGDDLRNDGLLFEPEKMTKRIVIHVHGTADAFYGQRFIDNFAAEFTKKGWAFLPFNNRGSGMDFDMRKEVDGKYVREVVIGANKEIFEDCVIDIQSAVDFARGKGYTEIVLMGHSYGCNKVVHYARETGFAGRLVLFAPCDLADLGRGGQLFWKFRDINNFDLFKYRNREIVPALAKIKGDILIEMGTNDKHIRQPKPELIEYLTKSFPNARVTGHVTEGANHCFNGQEDVIARNVAEWLAQY